MLYLMRVCIAPQKMDLQPGINVPTQEPTIAPGITEELRTRELYGSSKKEEMLLSIWDFAGQDLYYTTHQVSYVNPVCICHWIFLSGWQVARNLLACMVRCTDVVLCCSTVWVLLHKPSLCPVFASLICSHTCISEPLNIISILSWQSKEYMLYQTGPWQLHEASGSASMLNRAVPGIRIPDRNCHYPLQLFGSNYP